MTDLYAEGGGSTLAPDVPDFDGAIAGGRCEHISFRRTPLQLFNTASVPCEWPRVSCPPFTCCSSGDIYVAVIVTSYELPSRNKRRPIDTITFGLMHAEGRYWFVLLWG